MKRFQSWLSALTIAMVLPGVARAGGTCDQLCGATKDSVKSAIADPKCRGSATCSDCVANSVITGQQGTQCQGYTSTKKSSTSQTIATVLYTATGITCSIACGITLTGYGSSMLQPLSKACGGLGLVTSVADIGMAIAANDIAGGLMGAVGGVATATKNIGVLKHGVQTVVTATGKKATAQAKSLVCINAAIYMGTAVMKGISQKKLKKAQTESCGIVESLAQAANAPVQACLASAGSTGPTSTTVASFFTPTPETFPVISTDDVVHQAAVGGQTGAFMQDMKADLDAAVAAGKIDLNDIAKRLNNGEDVSAIAASAGVPSQIMDPLKEFEEKAKAGQTSAYLASLSGSGGYSGGAVAAKESANGNEGLAFGNAADATPGEGAESLEIDRKPAEAGLAGDGDVFHGAFAGTIFDIVTSRLKAQKGNYAELAPEGRMNRLFNGYGDPATKGARRPAAAGDRSAK